MASQYPLKHDLIVQQMPYLDWIWSNAAAAEHTAWALNTIAQDPWNIEAWQVLAAMTLEDPSLHLEVLLRIRVLSPEDVTNERRIRFYTGSLFGKNQNVSPKPIQMH